MTMPISCPGCGGTKLRDKGRYHCKVRHGDIGMRRCRLIVEAHKWQCRDCGRYFCQRFIGILAWQRSTELFEEFIDRQHLDGINRSRLGRREGIGEATVERYCERHLARQHAEWHPPECPKFLGVDEHFFTHRQGYATTLCDLKNHKVYDVVPGHSQLALEAYLQRLQGKSTVQLVAMDLSATYRSIVQKHFPNG